MTWTEELAVMNEEQLSDQPIGGGMKLTVQESGPRCSVVSAGQFRMIGGMVSPTSISRVSAQTAPQPGDQILARTWTSLVSAPSTRLSAVEPEMFQGPLLDPDVDHCTWSPTYPDR